MKSGREIRFGGSASPQEAVRRILRVRFAECLERQRALENGDDETVHAFRLSCKRLRYAIERFEPPESGLTGAAELLAQIAAGLGTAHDCAVLARRATQCGADLVARRALRDRDRCVRRAAGIWQRGFSEAGAFAPLAAYTGFSWRQS